MKEGRGRIATRPLGGAMPACTPRGPSPDFRHLQMSESWVRSIREESDIARDQGLSGVGVVIQRVNKCVAVNFECVAG